MKNFKQFLFPLFLNNSIFMTTVVLFALRITIRYSIYLGFPDGTVVKSLPANAGDVGSVPGSGRAPDVGNGNPLQYSCLKNSIDREAWQATVHGVAKNWT